MDSIFSYLRTHAVELGSRILESYPPLQSTKDPVAPHLANLLRKALPAQALAITGTAKYLRRAKAARIVAECGAGKTYMALGTIHVLADGRPSTTLVMCPSHITHKWAREVLLTIPRARAFLIEDMRNGGELRTLAGQIRQYFYKITLPWSDEGFRLLPSNFYFDLMARMREFEAGFEQGVESFLRVYPQYIEQVKPELNGLFREEDYPAVEKLRKKFGVKLEVLPIPSGADFRVQMSAEEQARVSREIDANVRESLMRGTEDLWKRLREVVAHMVDRLNEPESRFHGSLVTNVLDLVEILPRLNVNGDTDLNRFADQVKERLCNYSAQDLKKHDLLRVTTAADAANIVAEMDGLVRSRETAETTQSPSADDIFNRMSAYMEAPAAA